MKRIIYSVVSILGVLVLGACTSTDSESPTTFTIKIENTSTATSLVASVPVPLAPGVFVVHTEDNPLFTAGTASSAGLEAIAEDGNAAISAATLPSNAGVFDTPVGATGPGPLLPGSSYSFNFSAVAGDSLSFATMFVQSNDWFYAPDGKGIALFDSAGAPVSGDVSAQVKLWDAGTEADEPAGLGAHQAPRQSGPNSGDADSNTQVRLVAADAKTNISGSAIEVVITSTASDTGADFIVNIKNVSTDATLTPKFPVPLAPGVGVIHSDSGVLFKANAVASAGLEALAEDGNAAVLASEVANSIVFNTPVGADAPGPIFPGGAYEFEVEASKGDHLSFATMFVQSNDLFYAPAVEGIALFDTTGKAISGDVSSQVKLWDAGTEADETPGLGANQAPRQTGPNTGDIDSNTLVRAVTGDSKPNTTNAIIKVTVTPK